MNDQGTTGTGANAATPIVRFPRRSRRIVSFGSFVANEAGRFFLDRSNPASERSQESSRDVAFAIEHGFAASADNGLALSSHRARTLARRAIAGSLDYLILVPTLRCNLACSYCQVSRAPADSAGFDWSEETTQAVERMLDRLETTSVKIEFQGGEPTLRLDLVERIIARCERFAERSFVICTNLSELGAPLLGLLERPDVTVSTSLDGTAAVHARQRTKSSGQTKQFFENLEALLSRFGSAKVSALPTVDQTNPPDPDELIEAYAAYGIDWPAAGLMDTEMRCFIELEEQHATKKAQPRVQA